MGTLKRFPTKKVCPTCHSEFNARRSQQIYCSNKCSPGYAQPHKPTIYPKTLNTGTIGALGELNVCTDLLMRSYAVFRAVSPTCYCDLIATKGGEILIIEVRTGWQRNGRFFFAKTAQPGVNCIALWDRNTGDIFYLDPLSHLEISIA